MLACLDESGSNVNCQMWNVAKSQSILLHLSRMLGAGIIAYLLITLITGNEAMSYAILDIPGHFGAFTRYTDIKFGGAARQKLDIYKPTGAALRPIVIFWYGGEWIKGSKTDYEFVGAALANAGFVAVLPDYRLYPQARFPEFIEDGARAVQWTWTHATAIGGDPHALFLMGHSAGAHIAASLALDPAYLRSVGGNSSWIRGWVGLSGPYELGLLNVRPGILTTLLPKKYRPSDWLPIETPIPPTLLIHGADDDLVDPQETIELQRRLLATSAAIDCHIYAHVTHVETVTAFSPLLRFEAPTLKDVINFINRTVAGTPINTHCLKWVLPP